MADIIILAEHAFQITVSKKNGARTAASHQGRLLAKMWTVTGNQSFICYPAFALFSLQAVYLAVSGTNSAILQYFPGLFSSLFKLSRFE
jgi:hypothetical protein